MNDTLYVEIWSKPVRISARQTTSEIVTEGALPFNEGIALAWDALRLGHSCTLSVASVRNALNAPFQDFIPSDGWVDRFNDKVRYLRSASENALGLYPVN